MFFQDFKKFIMRGNVLDMAVGIIIGGSFGGIVNSLVNDVIMPPIGLLMGRVDFSNLFFLLATGSVNPGPYESLTTAKEAGAVTINYGLFLNTIINFLILAFAMFVLIQWFNRIQLQPAKTVDPTTKDCPFCYSTINVKATRCPNCTSELKG
jgi:large conductance mechanosensitive channel